MTPELAVARAVQWQRDWHAWLADPDSGFTAEILLGAAVGVIEDLALTLTERVAIPPAAEATAQRVAAEFAAEWAARKDSPEVRAGKLTGDE